MSKAGFAGHGGRTVDDPLEPEAVVGDAGVRLEAHVGDALVGGDGLWEKVGAAQTRADRSRRLVLIALLDLWTLLEDIS